MTADGVGDRNCLAGACPTSDFGADDQVVLNVLEPPLSYARSLVGELWGSGSAVHLCLGLDYDESRGGVMDKTHHPVDATDTRRPERHRLLVVRRLQEIECNPPSAEDVAMFEMFERERGTPEQRRRHILLNIRSLVAE
jgi:hypothetical protein